ncbi:MAG: hypothetical protein ACLGI6_18890, partial [Gammaproteobacteria bacterium]
WEEGSAAHPASYLRQMEQLGFVCRFKPHRGTLADSAVTRFFPSVQTLEAAHERLATLCADAPLPAAPVRPAATAPLKRALLEAVAEAGPGKSGAPGVGTPASPYDDVPDWLGAGLITRDILARFPYHEHPAHVAHVARLAAEMGVSHDFALKTMADRVLPAPDVLRTCEPALLETRRLVCSNGLAAADPDACLANWQRLGLQAHDAEVNRGTVISTVVRHRGVPARRTRQLAELLVRRLHADFHVLVGSPPPGLREAWDDYAAGLTLWPELPAPGGPLAVLRQLARRWRIVTSCAQLQARLRIMLAGVGAPAVLARHRGDPAALAAALKPLRLAHSDELLAFHQFDLTMLQQYEALEERVQRAGDTPNHALDMTVRTQFETWFQQRLIVIEEDAGADAILHALSQATPPGFCNRSMGPTELDDASPRLGRLAGVIDGKLRAVRERTGR